MDATAATALRQLEAGAVLILLDVPFGTEVGLDYNVWNIGPKFRGVRTVTPGVHFLFHAVSAGGGGRQTGPRSGQFFEVVAGDVIVRRFNPLSEDLEPAPEVEDALRESREGLLEFANGLAPYPFDKGLRSWLSLTTRVSGTLVSKLSPPCGRICSVLPPSATAPMEEDMAPATGDDTGEGDHTMRLTRIPKRCLPEGVAGPDITRWSIDRSPALELVLGHMAHETDLLGELQFVYIAFLLGQVYDAFEHWKSIVALICNCEQALRKRPNLFIEFIGILHFQLKETPDDYFTDLETKSNTVIGALRTLFSNVHTTPGINSELRTHTHDLEKLLRERFGWNDEEEDGEDAPVVVSIEE
eukprot:m.137570 g.137570  ORF g.137570 m.137570 type:complete len:357 (+) comp13981_c0_seq2:222-1292(+)